MTNLNGCVVATTRDDAPGDALVGGLRSLGSRVVVWPTLRFESTDSIPLPRVHYDWVVLTSPRAVAEIARRDFDVADVRIAAVGVATARTVTENGWRVAIRGDHGAAELARAIIANAPVTNKRVLFPTNPLAAASLETILRDAGARVDRVHVYRTIPVPPDPQSVRRDLDQGVDIVTFASPSAVMSLRQSLGADWPSLLQPLRIVAIGRTTADSLRESGIDRVTVAPTPSAQGLIDACVSVASTLDRMS